MAAIPGEHSKPRLKQPWLKAAEKDYIPNFVDTISLTNISRGSELIEIIDREIVGNITEPSICVVGVGFQIGSSPDNGCPYVPYRLAAHFSYIGLPDYTMTLVDINEKALNDLAVREEIVVEGRILTHPFRPKEKKALDQYLLETNQTARLVTTEGAIMITAQVPHDFRKNIESGKIIRVHADIASIELNYYGLFDIVDASYLFYQLNHAGQKKAMATIAQALKPNGRLLVTDSDGRNPMFMERGGWLDYSKLEDLQLVKENAGLVNDTFYEMALFKKIM